VTYVGYTLAFLGVAFVLLAAVGILRFPDVLTRTSASTKAAGLGVALVLAGAAFLFGTTEAAVKLTLAVALQFVTAPVSGHVIGRAAYRSGAPLWEGTHTDELRAYYVHRDAASGERPATSPPVPKAERDADPRS
jgi:multicomponent Na+:H+ antiporter subunit G